MSEFPSTNRRPKAGSAARIAETAEGARYARVGVSAGSAARRSEQDFDESAPDAPVSIHLQARGGRIFTRPVVTAAPNASVAAASARQLDPPGADSFAAEPVLELMSNLHGPKEIDTSESRAGSPSASHLVTVNRVPSASRLRSFFRSFFDS